MSCHSSPVCFFFSLQVGGGVVVAVVLDEVAGEEQQVDFRIGAELIHQVAQGVEAGIDARAEFR